LTAFPPEIARSAREWFGVDVDMSPATFSTLDGNGPQRSARQRSHELTITMYPRWSFASC
jgi:hypothetical protein